MKIVILALAFICLSSAFTLAKTSALMKIVKPTTPATSVSNIPWTFKVCGTGRWTPSTLELSNAPTNYLNFNFFWSGVANADIEFQRCDIEILYNGGSVGTLSDTSFTDSFSKGDTVQYARGLTSQSPWPSGKIDLVFRFFNSAGTTQGCVSFTFNL